MVFLELVLVYIFFLLPQLDLTYNFTSISSYTQRYKIKKCLRHTIAYCLMLQLDGTSISTSLLPSPVFDTSKDTETSKDNLQEVYIDIKTANIYISDQKCCKSGIESSQPNCHQNGKGCYKPPTNLFHLLFSPT